MKLALALAVSLVVAACSGEATEPVETTAAVVDTTAPAPEPAETTAPAPEPATGKVAAAETSLGTVLVDGDGRTLYIFTVDVGDVSACYSDCAQTWPAVGSGAVLAEGVDVTTGVTTRDDGNEQLTINSRPVYLFAGDSGPGDVNGQNVGEVWFVIGLDGEPIVG